MKDPLASLRLEGGDGSTPETAIRIRHHREFLAVLRTLHRAVYPGLPDTRTSGRLLDWQELAGDPPGPVEPTAPPDADEWWDRDIPVPHPEEREYCRLEAVWPGGRRVYWLEMTEPRREARFRNEAPPNASPLEAAVFREHLKGKT